MAPKMTQIFTKSAKGGDRKNWVLIVEEKKYDCPDDTQYEMSGMPWVLGEMKMVGSYPSKTKAIESARVAMSNLPRCKNIFDKSSEWGTAEWGTFEDNSDELGDEGGIIFDVGSPDTDLDWDSIPSERSAGWRVSIKRVSQSLKRRTKADQRTKKDDSGSEYDEEDKN